jgi:hypothetical protein
MTKKINTQLLLILVLTVVFGFVVFILAKTIDKNVAEVTSIKSEIDELTRVAVKTEERVKNMNSVNDYKEFFDNSLSDISEMIQILEQLEVIANLSENELSLKLEEGVIGEGGIEFKDENQKQEFIQSLEVKEFSTEPTETQEETDPAVENVALLAMQEDTAEMESEIKISYLEMDVNLKGSYHSVRTFISLLQNSKYYFNIKEVKINETEEGNVNASLIVRAFLFESESS